MSERSASAASPALTSGESEAPREANKRIKLLELLERENEVVRRAAAHLWRAHLPGK